MHAISVFDGFITTHIDISLLRDVDVFLHMLLVCIPAKNTPGCKLICKIYNFMIQ